MCGIAGIVGSNKIRTGIEEVLGKIGHRGPDGKGFWKDGNIALAHARLSIIDLTENGSQPMVDPITGNVIVFNGEIYNYLEIKDQLKSKYSFQTDSDTEVILAAYQNYGIDFLNHLRGMFAFALYDKAKNQVLLVRDRVGIKPLYYRTVNGALLFASEIKAIINIDNGKEEVNEVKAYEFLANRQLDCDEQTLFKGVFQIPPANYVWVSSEGKIGIPKEFWSFPELGNRSFDETARQELLNVFNETIKIHLRSDVPVGSFLSGGLDSSSITCFALKNMQQANLHTFSAVLPYEHPENMLIDDVVNMSNRIIPHKFLLSGDNFFDDIPNVIYHHDEPIMDGSMYAHYKLCEMAKANNIKVLLSGSGGDELFGGYASHIYAHHAKMVSDFRLGAYLTDIKKISKNSSNSYKSLVFKSLYECVPVNLRRIIKNRQLKQKNKHLTVQPKIPHYYFEHKDPYYANLLNNYKSWTVPPYLHYEDRNSMAFGVETRVPFFDHVLIEFILQFSTDDIIKGRSKSLIRDSFTGVVPDSILQQKGKYGFPSPIDHALINDKKGKEIFYDLYKNTPFLHEGKTEQIAKDFYNGKGNLTTYWRLLSFMMWNNIYMGNK